MGIFTQTFWNTVHGRFMENTLEEIPNHFGVHFSPALLLLVPGFFLFPSAYYFLIVQTLLLALGAIPLYLVALRKIGSKKLSILFAAAYLLYPGLHWLNIFDFHEISLFIPFFLWAFYFFEKRVNVWAFVFLFLAALTREDAALITAFFGLYVMLNKTENKWSRKKIIAGGLIFVISILYILAAAKIFMPAFGGGFLRLDRYQHLGGGASEIVSNIVANPSLFADALFSKDKLIYIFWMFLPVLFLPFFALRGILLFLPGLLENLLASYSSQFSGLYQYDAVVIPGIFLAAILGFEFLSEKTRNNKILFYLFLVAALFTFAFRSPLSPFNFPFEILSPKFDYSEIRKIVNEIPEKYSVASQANILPHAAGREKIYLLGSEKEPPQILIIDGNDYFGFESAALFQKYVNRYYYSGNYDSLVISGRYLLLYEKGSGFFPETQKQNF